MDELIDRHYKLDEMDYFFYLASAYLIGEPVKELSYFTSLDDVDISKPFGLNFKQLSESIESAIEKKNFYDTYILKIDDSYLTSPIDEIDPDSLSYHTWIKECLNSLKEENKEYEIPISDNLLTGLMAQFFTKFDETLPFEQFDQKTEWLNIKNALESSDRKYVTIVDNIRTAIEVACLI